MTRFSSQPGTAPLLPSLPLAAPAALWHHPGMQEARAPLNAKLIASLYTEAMLLADEARSYFDAHGRDDRDSLDPLDRVGFSCESLKVTTRLMHVIAWLLTQRAVEAGELSRAHARRPARRLGDAPDSDEALLERLPESAQSLIHSSRDLYARVRRLDEAGGLGPEPQASPARSLMSRLERSL
jgi:regulator of CtrA degradation